MKVFDDEKDLLMDHEYDGIRELDNHMPVWWLWLFYFTIAWGIGYMLYYYMLGGPTQEELYEQEMATAAEQYGLEPEGDGIEAEVSDFTWAFLEDQSRIEEGREIYMSNGNLCYTCHGANGEGIVGPNITDDLWIHGCSAEEIASSIIEGYPDRGMIAYGSGARLSDEQVQSLVSYIASIQGTEPANAKAPIDRAVPCSLE